MASIRYIPHSFPPYRRGDGAYIDSPEAKSILEKSRQWLRENIISYQSEYPVDTTVSPSNDTRRKSRDPSIYIGAGGNAYVQWKLSQYYLSVGNNDCYIEHLMKSIEAIHTALSIGGDDGIAFYIGKAGLYTLAALIYNSYSEPVKTETYLNSLLSCLPAALSPSPDEVLYGRAGYLSCLLIAKKYLPADVCTKCNLDGAMRQMFDTMIASGQQGHKKILRYFYYGSEYVGAAHGTAGILFTLLHCPVDWINEPNIKPLLVKTIDHLVSAQLPSGNFPPQDSGKRDGILVHWCHGSPGVIPLLFKAHQLFGGKNYLSSLNKSVQNVWDYGILKKGNGLCHGITGNAYSLLYLYRETHNEEYLYKTLMMAQCVWNEEIQEQVKVQPDPQRFKVGEPNHPYSLMEGLGGTICFFADLLKPETAAFPGWDFS